MRKFARGLAFIVGLMLAGAGLAPHRAIADPVTPRQSASPYHRAQDGNGQIIPCRCSLHGQLVPLGTLVCMSTHLGTQIARCDLDVNVTSWVPTGIHCETSQSTPLSTGHKS